MGALTPEKGLLCAGCPHRGAYLAAKESVRGVRGAVVCGNVGCVAVGFMYPGAATCLGGMDRLPARCANAYCFDAQRSEYYTNIYSVDAKGTGAGGAFTTVLDVRRFWEGLYGGRILSRETLVEMTSLHAGDGREFYGYGMWLERSPEGLTPYFEGLDPGVSFLSKRYRDGTIVTAVSNLEQNVWQLVREIAPVLKP